MNVPIDQKPATCAGCHKRSKPRPAGQAPEGWVRQTGGFGVRYWCEGCRA